MCRKTFGAWQSGPYLPLVHHCGHRLLDGGKVINYTKFKCAKNRNLQGISGYMPELGQGFRT